MSENVPSLPRPNGRWGEYIWPFWIDPDNGFDLIDCVDDSHSFTAGQVLGLAGDFDEEFGDSDEIIETMLGRGWLRGRYQESAGSFFLQGPERGVLKAARYIFDSGNFTIREIVIDIPDGFSAELKGDDMMIWMARGRVPKGAVREAQAFPDKRIPEPGMR